MPGRGPHARRDDEEEEAHVHERQDPDVAVGPLLGGHVAVRDQSGEQHHEERPAEGVRAVHACFWVCWRAFIENA